MESRPPADRLLVGDVGFGKTEVAVRAAFKAVMDGYQVALLAPTTVLAVPALRDLPRALRSVSGTRGDGLALPLAGRGQARSWPISRSAPSTC